MNMKITAAEERAIRQGIRQGKAMRRRHFRRHKKKYGFGAGLAGILGLGAALTSRRGIGWVSRLGSKAKGRGWGKTADRLRRLSYRLDAARNWTRSPISMFKHVRQRKKGMAG